MLKNPQVKISRLKNFLNASAESFYSYVPSSGGSSFRCPLHIAGGFAAVKMVGVLMVGTSDAIHQCRALHFTSTFIIGCLNLSRSPALLFWDTLACGTKVPAILVICLTWHCVFVLYRKLIGLEENSKQVALRWCKEQ